MATTDPPPDFGLYDKPSRPGRWLAYSLLGFSFSLFVLGGLYFGWLFLANWKTLAARQMPISVSVPGSDQVISLQPPPFSLPPVPALPGIPRGEQAPGRPALPLLPEWTDRERLNVLLMGIDHRDDEPIDGSRSDTLMIVSVDPTTRSVTMISLPRDLWVSIPGYGEQRINVAHSLGGPDLAMRTVAANFGVRVNHYARINFRGFEQIVDTLGGVPVDVERPIKDDEFPTENYGVMRIYIPPGPQWMDGRTALQYARSRHSENDFGRARRQQRLLLAIRERALQANMILKAFELVPLAQKTISTDFGPLDLVKLAKLSTQIDRERIATLVIDVQYATPLVTADGAEVLIPNRAAIQSAINQAFTRTASAPLSQPVEPTAEPIAPAATSAPTAPPVQTRIEVLNGTSRLGLAASTADWLRQKGFVVTRVDSAERADYAETRLFAQPGREAAASSLASALGLAATAVQPTAAAPDAPDLRLVLGQNYRLPAR